MMFYELLDVVFFVNEVIETLTDCFNIPNYLKFTACNTHSSNIRLVDTKSSGNSSIHFYFNSQKLNLSKTLGIVCKQENSESFTHVD